MRTVLLPILLLSSSVHALAPSVTELAQRNADAKGGADKLRSITSMQRAGKLILGGGQIEVDYVETRKRTGSAFKDGAAARIDATLQGLTLIEAWDGNEGWRIDPFAGRRDPERIPLDDAKPLIELSEIEGPLVGWQEKGHKLEYLGVEDVDGTNAHKIKVTRKNGDVQLVYLDPSYFLEIRIESQRMVRGSLDESLTDYGEWGLIGGALFPFSIEAGSKRSSHRTQFKMDRGDVNTNIDDGVFRFPQKAPPPVPNPSTKPTVPDVKPAPGDPIFDAGTISGLGARNIGSAAMSGRIAALAANVERDGKVTVFVGAASGGVWKSTDGATTFRPVFDDQASQSIGALAIDPTNTRIVWAGTGEGWTRNSVSIGDGIYKSTDGGETFRRVGLERTERITRIEIDPRNGNVVWACAPGPLWSDSNDRGLYKTSDGGKTWDLVLTGTNGSTGCGSVSVDIKNPDVIYASLWDHRRKGWTFRSGGEGPEAPSQSGLYKSVDGGKTWSELTPAPKPYGRVAVNVAPSDSKRVYAFIESTSSALWVSNDAGKTWQQRDKSQWMVWRPFYFAHMVIDPTNADRVFKMNGNLILSEDAGKSFSVVGGFVGMHGDLHDLWVNPKNPKHIIAGDDGGLWLSYDGGNKWWKGDNLPISQFYHVAVDDADPYRVYGGLQDNSSWVGDSQYPGGITNARWENMYYGDGFWMLPDPSDPDYLYAEYQGGFLARIHRHTHQARDIQPKAKANEKLRFNWNTPIALSPHEKGTLYIGAQFLFRTRDHGQSWERISPDLTTNDPAKQQQEKSGGVTVDNSAAEMHTTIYAIAESPKRRGLIWVGTDDGNIQITRDSGKSWTNVVANVPDLPKNSWVSWIEPSRHDAGTAYVAFDRHTFGDMTPWLFVTRDYGASFSAILSPKDTKGVRGFAHVVREDLVRPGLLFIGTELGLWISVDRGARWAAFKGGRFPAAPVRDIAIHERENDLVLGTHGRGIWIVDDITPLRDLSDRVLAEPIAFTKSRVTQQRISGPGGWANGAAVFVGENPPDGAVITYHQRDRHMFGAMKIEVLDAKGNLIDTLPAGMRRGLNRVVWSMRTKPPRVPPAVQLAGSATVGPRVLPGTYTIRVTKGGKTFDTRIDVELDRRANYNEADRRAQFDAAMRVHALFGDETQVVMRVLTLRREIAARKEATKDPSLLEMLRRLDGNADAIRKMVVATTEGGAITGEERLREHTDQLYGAINGYEGRPGKYHLERIAALRSELDVVVAKLDTLIKDELPPVNDALKKGGLPPIDAPKVVQLDEITPERARWLMTLKRKDKKNKELDAIPVLRLH